MITFTIRLSDCDNAALERMLAAEKQARPGATITKSSLVREFILSKAPAAPSYAMPDIMGVPWPEEHLARAEECKMDPEQLAAAQDRIGEYGDA